MTIKRIKTSVITSLLFACNLASSAQGIAFHKTDGTILKVPYALLDSISTYSISSERKWAEDTKKVFTVNGVSFHMMQVKTGTFVMGSDWGKENEKPKHDVTITKDYYIGETEVTQALWKAVVGTKPSEWTEYYGLGDNYPAYSITYDEIQSFVTKLSQLTGEIFRLPTEAEWEYAARGGHKSKGYIYSGSNNLNEVAWYNENSNNKKQIVAQKLPNELGLYDMSGNVMEYCSDWFSSDYYSTSATMDPSGPSTPESFTIAGIALRTCRGGGYSSSADNGRITSRRSVIPSAKQQYQGFRVVLVRD